MSIKNEQYGEHIVLVLKRADMLLKMSFGEYGFHEE